MRHEDQLNQIKNTFQHFQLPFQELTDLGVRTWKRMSYPQAGDFAKLRKPEELVDISVKTFMKNSHETLNCMEEAFEILEKHMLSLSENLKDHTEKMVDEAKTTVRDVSKRAEKVTRERESKK